MQKTSATQRLRRQVCLLVLGVTLFIASCSNGGSSPASPGGTPHSTPTNNGGYSIIYSIKLPAMWQSLSHFLLPDK